MAKSKGKHEAGKNYYSSAKVTDVSVKHREARLTRHIKNHPEDEQAASASGSLKYRRYSSHNRNGWADMTNPTFNTAMRMTTTKKGESKPIDCVGFKPSELRGIAKANRATRKFMNAARFNHAIAYSQPDSV